MEHLRAIGEEFEAPIWYPNRRGVSPITNEVYATKLFYRVTSYISPERMGVDCVRVEHSRPRTSIPIVKGKLMLYWDESVEFFEAEPPPVFDGSCECGDCDTAPCSECNSTTHATEWCNQTMHRKRL